MKSKILFLSAMLLIVISGCKKDSPQTTPVIKTYTVKYQFQSTNVNATNFSVYYTDYDGSTKTVTNVRSGWTYYRVGTTGEYVSLSAQSFTQGASVLVIIDYDAGTLDLKQDNGTPSTFAYALANGILP